MGYALRDALGRGIFKVSTKVRFSPGSCVSQTELWFQTPKVLGKLGFLPFCGNENEGSKMRGNIHLGSRPEDGGFSKVTHRFFFVSPINANKRFLKYNQSDWKLL